MSKLHVSVALGLAMALLGSAPAAAAGVFIVSTRGVEAFDGAKAGFTQMAYGAQIAGFSPKAVDLTGTAADDAALTALAAQSPSLVFAVGGQAAKRVRKAMPEVWIVYGMVYYPEAEGLTQDPKMVGVATLGSAKGLGALLKTFTKAKSIAVMHAREESAAVSALIERLRAEGLDPQDRPVASAADLPAAFDAIKDQTKILLLLPDSLTSSPDGMRFLVSQCVQAGIMPVSLAEPLVASGALAASFYPPESVGAQAAKVAADLLKAGQPPAERVVNPADSATALNKSTAQALRITVPKTLRVEMTYE